MTDYADDGRLVFPAEAWPKFKAGLQYLADEPRRLYMPRFVEHLDGDGLVAEDVEFIHGSLPPCGTVCCLAGAIILADERDASFASARLALDILGLGAVDEYGLIIDEAGRSLHRIFMRTGIETYDELRENLHRRFVFPEPLPEPAAVPS